MKNVLRRNRAGTVRLACLAGMACVSFAADDAVAFTHVVARGVP